MPNPLASPVERILIVDDNADAAATLDVLLRSLGYEACVATDGIEALNVAPDFKPDVVLLDIGLPGMDGYEVARRLRNLVQQRPMRIVAVTGWGHEADKLRSREAGIDAHLLRPVNSAELQSALTGGAALH